MTKEDWNSIYFSTMAIASVAVGAVGVAIALLALQRTQAQAASLGSLEPPTGVAVDIPKVHYSNAEIFVEVRNPGEWLPMTSFVRPDDPYLTHAITEALSG